MEIRKGPYGHYVIKKIEDIDSIHGYTQKIVAENIPGHMLPLYIIPAVSRYEASYDFSGLIPISSCFSIPFPSDFVRINKLRRALGDLFFSIADLPDLLLSPSSIIFDERFIFTDEDLSDIRVCFDPVMVDPGDLNINSLTRTDIRKFLNSDSISTVLEPDEIDGILYAIEQNDSELLKKKASIISEPKEEPSSSPVLLDLNEFKLTMLTGIISLIFALLKMPGPALTFALSEVFFAYRTAKHVISLPKVVIPISEDDSKKQMLFGDGSQKASVMQAMILTSRDLTTGQTEKKAIYTDKATIGSDRFLCDIFTPDKEISPIHAQIRKAGRNYYVSDLSSDNTTFLNNVRLEPMREYEIKSDQTLMCGKREFRIEIL